MAKSKNSEYSAKDIFVLKGLDPVRKRPGMYIGSTGVQGLHHLIWECTDNSVTYETPVIIKENGKIKIEKVGKLINKYFDKNSNDACEAKLNQAQILRDGFNLEVLSFNPQTLKIEFKPAFSLIRHRTNSEIFRLTLQNGRQIDITPYHSLFTLKQGQVSTVRGSDLKIGSNVVVPKVLPKTKVSLKKIDLIQELLKLPESETENLVLHGNIKKLLDKKVYLKIKEKLQKQANKLNGQHPSNLFYDFKRYDYLPFNFLRDLNSSQIKKIKLNSHLGTKYNKKVQLDSEIKINRELIELLGIFAAEGCLVKNSKQYDRIAFSFGSHEKDFIQYTQKLIEKVFKVKTEVSYAHETARFLIINSYLITLIFKEIFGVGKGSDKKKVPNLIFNLDSYLRQRYLIAYLSGDGYPTKFWISHLISNTLPNDKERQKFSLSSQSKDFTSSLSYLLSSLGKSFSFQGDIKSKDRGFIEYNYKGKTKRAKVRNVKPSFRIDFYWNNNASYFNNLPFEEVVKNCYDSPTLNAFNNNQLGISSNKITKLVSQDKLDLYPGTLKLLNSNLGVLKVRKIEKIKYDYKWVYDFSVLGYENFIAGVSPICVHNSLDEAMGGHADEIEINLLPDNYVSVSDNGRGIPVDVHKETKKSALETVMTTLHAGAKFGKKTYQVSGGLHGVGVSVVCALSSELKAEVWRDGNVYTQEFSRGKAKANIKKGKKCPVNKTGTKITFKPDKEIFETLVFDRKTILNHLRRQTHLTKGVKIIFKDLREESNEFNYVFYFEGGLSSYVKYLCGENEQIHENTFYVSKMINDMLVEVAFKYTQERETYEESFANNIFTAEGGSHITGFRTALTRAINEYAKNNDYLKKDEEALNGKDVRIGINAAVSVKLKEPQFEGQTKAKLGNPEAKSAVETVTYEALMEFLERYSSDARAIIQNSLLAAKARKAASAARQTVLRKGMLEGLTLPGKLSDCSSKKPEESELFIVEGQSAGGSAKGGRDRRFQAILPLRGKILNVERATLTRMLTSDEVKALVIALGTAIAQDFDLSSLRYHRIIIATDADSDGAHIRTLLLTLFFRYFKPIIDKGYLYIARPPLYKIQSGKRMEYAYNEEDKKEILEDIKKEKSLKINIQRYKGLGEMNADQLWETTMNPENRILLRVTIEDAKEADRIFDTLMGKEVASRKKFIQAHAKSVKNLDI